MASVQRDHITNHIRTMATTAQLVVQILSLFCFLNAILAADYSVATYGAVPNDATNDWTAIQNTINAARSSASRVIFPKGTYYLDQTLKVAPAVSGGLCKLTFEGQGSTLVFTNWVIAFSISNCNGLNFRNISIDYDPLPFTFGKVVALDVSSSTFDIAIDTRSNNALTKPVQAYYTYNVNKKRPGDSGASDPIIQSVDVYQLQASTASVVVSKNATTTVLRVHSEVGLSGYSRLKGQSIVMRYKVYATDAFQISSTKNVQWNYVYVYSAPGMGINSYHCTNLTLDRFFVLKKSGRAMSTCADGVHFTNPRGNVVIKNSIIEGQGDDGVNIHNTMMTVTANGAEMTLNKANGVNEFPDMMWAGDKIGFGNPNDPFHPYFIATVKSVRGISTPKYGYNVTFVEDVSSVVVGSYAVLETIASATISKSIFRNNRARGVLVNNRNTVVENCTFDQTSGPAVFMNCETSWLEGNCAQNVIVRNNRISDCNYQFASPGLILLRSLDSTKKPYSAGVYKNITITGNVFLGPNTASFFNLGSTDTATITNNLIANNQTTGGRPIISVCNSINVYVSGNTVTSPGQFIANDTSCTSTSSLVAYQAAVVQNFDAQNVDDEEPVDTGLEPASEDVSNSPSADQTIEPSSDQGSTAAHVIFASVVCVVALATMIL